MIDPVPAQCVVVDLEFSGSSLRRDHFFEERRTPCILRDDRTDYSGFRVQHTRLMVAFVEEVGVVTLYELAIAFGVSHMELLHPTGEE